MKAKPSSLETSTIYFLRKFNSLRTYDAHQNVIDILITELKKSTSKNEICGKTKKSVVSQGKFPASVQ